MAAKTRHKKSAVKIQHCPMSSKFDMWVDNDVPNWFLTLKNFNRHYSNQNKISVSGINSGHHNLPTYEISLKSNNVEYVRLCGCHFEKGNR
jgi:hypothetical protein